MRLRPNVKGEIVVRHIEPIDLIGRHDVVRIAASDDESRAGSPRTLRLRRARDERLPERGGSTPEPTTPEAPAESAEAAEGAPVGEASAAQTAPAAEGESATAEGKECCKGMNECKGKGGCAVEGKHECKGTNECKGQGGCNGHCPK